MKALIILVFGLEILIGCKTESISPNNLIGRWNHTYSVKDKNADGTWSEWHQINTLVALPVLEFTENGKILWDGKASTACCTFLSYELNEDIITLKDLVTSEFCNNVKCKTSDNWTIIKLTDEILEIESGNSASRYQRAN